MAEDVADGVGNKLMIDDLVAQSNIPKVETFLFKAERVSDWMELVEQAMVGVADAVKFQCIMKYVYHGLHKEVNKVIAAANDSWVRFKDGMQRKFKLGNGLLTTAGLEAMNRDDFTTVGALAEEFKKKVHQFQMRVHKQKRKERDATATETPGVKRIITDVLAELGYGKDPVVPKKVVTTVQGKGKESIVEEVAQEEWDEESVPQHLLKAQGPSDELSIGKVILEPEEARTKREAEKEAFEFKTPTELASQPIASQESVAESLPVSAEESESAQGSTKGSMDVLLEALGTMQEGVSTPIPDRRVEAVREEVSMVLTGEMHESRPQRLDTPEYVP
ncbi:hypothetical protein CBR_g50949 [Chara braunii]|uniref:Uncharacterized protein n=1 Tax=Chara braunii TaxID=69332 RepID=A0A388M7W5_CHABU|nr:hypothetical protein CBR_g50949 [Chara braunii]|eukprot:GBG90605.1 hypothetical protein CBR_g50949 [Chara braunii]